MSSNRICSIDGCERPHRSRGWCNIHYQIQWKQGLPPLPLQSRQIECSVDGCERPLKSRGWCDLHYHRWRRYGSPDINLRPIDAPLEVRFWPKVEKGGPVAANRPDLGSCWVWVGAKDGHGYGVFKFNGSLVRAHRLSYELVLGAIPDGFVLDHLCRIRCCVNPAHLESVANGENVLRGGGASATNARKTHCPRGHVYDLANTYRRPSNKQRECRACARARRHGGLQFSGGEWLTKP